VFDKIAQQFFRFIRFMSANEEVFLHRKRMVKRPFRGDSESKERFFHLSLCSTEVKPHILTYSLTG
jgi:hypothetical protein